MKKNHHTVLSIGISTIDYLCEIEHFPVPDEKMRAKEFVLEGGGNAANTAVALARLGCHVKILSRIGDDHFGKQCLEFFNSEGIDTELLQVDSIPTPFSFVLVDNSQHTRTIIHCSKPSTIDYTFAPSHLDNVDFIYADGRQLKSYETLLIEASQRGVKIAIEAERKTLDCSSYFPFAHIVFASRQFHREQFGSEDFEANLNAILAQGPQMAITTLGNDGVIVKTKEVCFRESGFPITPVDTTGAGDAFNAAFLYAYMQDTDLPKAARFANWYAAEACKKFGSRAGLLRKSDINNTI